MIKIKVKYLCFILIIFLIQINFAGCLHAHNFSNAAKLSIPAVGVVYTDGSVSTGFFVSSEGAFITNLHVLQDAEHCSVKIHTGEVFGIKEIISVYPECDLVLMQVDTENRKVHALPVSSRIPQIGEEIIVIGAPHGLEYSVTTGIISAIRDVDLMGRVYQISAPIYPGSSGSPVLSFEGKLLGVAFLTLSGGDNLNFAIPASKVRSLISNELNKTKTTK